MMEFLNVDEMSIVPVFEQIERQVQFAVASGRLKPTEKLPPVWETAKQLGVNVNTVRKAFRDLQVMGIVYTLRGQGTFISPGITKKCRETCRKQIIGRLHEVVAEAKAAGLTSKDLQEAVRKAYANAPDL